MGPMTNTTNPTDTAAAIIRASLDRKHADRDRERQLDEASRRARRRDGSPVQSDPAGIVEVRP